jgi:hypothetical protein
MMTTRPHHHHRSRGGASSGDSSSSQQQQPAAPVTYRRKLPCASSNLCRAPDSLVWRLRLATQFDLCREYSRFPLPCQEFTGREMLDDRRSVELRVAPRVPLLSRLPECRGMTVAHWSITAPSTWRGVTSSRGCGAPSTASGFSPGAMREAFGMCRTPGHHAWEFRSPGRLWRPAFAH